MTAEKIPAWLKQVLMPELIEIKGELKAINARVDSTNERIDSLRTEMSVRIDSTNARIDSLRTEMNVRLDSLEKRIPVIEKIAALEIKMADLEKRLVAA